LPRMQLVTIVLLILPTNFLFFYCFKMDWWLNNCNIATSFVHLCLNS
jgi:hypothetical protein